MKKKNCDKMSFRSSRICKICNKVIAGSSYKFKAHLYQHNAVESRFKCCLCDKEFFRRDIFKAHMEGHAGKKPKQMFICDHCDRTFVNKRNLQLHLKVHDDSHRYQYKCIACGASYCEERLLKYHIRKTHYNLKDNETANIKKELNETWLETVRETEVCVEMKKVDSNTLQIKKLDKIKSEVKSKIKNEVSDEKTRFKEYISSVFAQKDSSHYSKAKCDYCNKEMLKKSLLPHIRERHLKLKRFKCDECSKSFSRHYQLVDHVCGKVKGGRGKKIEG